MPAHLVLSVVAAAVAVGGWFAPPFDRDPAASPDPTDLAAHGDPTTPPTPPTTPAAGIAPYRPPVDAPVVDVFRPPATPYGPGNRGLDYATVQGTPIRAVGDGVVTFAGRIAFAWYVTVQHADGLRSSLSFLSSVSVSAGERVRRGDVVGVASDRVQLGFRRGDEYLDPAPLLTAGARRPRARLVPPRGSPVDAPRR